MVVASGRKTRRLATGLSIILVVCLALLYDVLDKNGKLITTFTVNSYDDDFNKTGSR